MHHFDIATATQNQSLDEICFKHYGRTAGTVEAVLLFNPGLADLGVHLPLGTKIKLPVIENNTTTSLINLWN